MEVDSQLNFQMAALHITLAFRGGEVLPCPPRMAQQRDRNYPKWHIWISVKLTLEALIWKHGALSEGF